MQARAKVHREAKPKARALAQMQLQGRVRAQAHVQAEVQSTISQHRARQGQNQKHIVFVSPDSLNRVGREEPTRKLLKQVRIRHS